ncbi:glycosyltransferase family 34 protein, partial [Baudoinia panamericana UAMH 10762]
MGEDVRDGVSEEDRLGARTRVGKCTIVFNGNSWWERALRTHEEHDKIQGYRLYVLRQNLLDDVWSKPAYVLSLLLREMAKPENERLEWLLWFDVDTIILNPYIPLETFLPPVGTEFDDIHLMYSNDWNGLNNGVFPVRVNQWSVQLFSAILSYRYYRPEASLQFRDQSAMDALMHEPKFSKHIVQAPQRWFNAYQGEHNETLAPFQIRRGDLLVHFAGVPGRESRMQYWLERAEQHLDDWEIAVKSTSYPQEARDFW